MDMPTTEKLKRISPEEFVAEYFKTDKNGALAVRRIQPELTELSARNKASRLLTNAHVKLLIDDIEDTLKIGAIKGVTKAVQLIESKNEQVATTNIWKLIEHVRGTAIQRQQVHSTSVNLNLDLTKVTEEDA